MNYGSILKTDIADGPGVRVTLFVSGCRNRCPGCHNAEAQDFSFGKHFGEAAEDEIIAALKPDYIKGLTLCGGEPFEPENQPSVLELTRQVKARFPQKEIWAFTGNRFDDDLLAKKCGPWDVTEALLGTIDVLVDGAFVEELKDMGLRFRGSSNQRLIDVPATLARKEVVLWNDGYETM